MPRFSTGPREDRSPLAEELAKLDREQLQSLILEVARRDPNLSRTIEDEIAQRLSLLSSSTNGQPIQRQPPPDLKSVRYQMKTAMGLTSGPRYHSGWYDLQLGSGARDLLDHARTCIVIGDGRTAMDILEAMTDEAMGNWEAVEDEQGTLLTFVSEDLGTAWTEAVLSADLSPAERERWTERLDAWARELEDYNDPSNFEAAVLALKEGWDDPTLQATLRGETAESDDDASEARERRRAFHGSALRQLTIARLKVLERQRRIEEYLNLARAEGQTARYTVMLVRQGRVAEAVEYALTHLNAVPDVLQVAQTLQEAGEVDRALQVGEYGLDLEGRKVELGTWLADLAARVGRKELAVHAATVSFKEQPTLVSYLRVAELAGEEWPAIREELLNDLREVPIVYHHGAVDIFLHEGLIDDAIALIDRGSYVSHHLVEQVADAAMGTHPDWVIDASRKQAESIMNRGKADHYGSAVNWLAKAKAAYIATARKDEWDTYLKGLLAEHQRKHKLVPMLKRLA